MYMRKKLRNVLEWVGWILMILLIYIGISSSLRKIPPDLDSYNPGFYQYPILTLLHAVPGLLFMILGPLQFIPQLRSKYIAIHRWMGRLFMVSAVLIGISGFLIVFVFPFAGVSEQLAILFYGTIFMYSVIKSFYSIKQGEVKQHREWIIRVYSIGLGISVIRILIALFMTMSSYKQIEIFALTFWMGFGITWMVGEFWIRFTRVA